MQLKSTDFRWGGIARSFHWLMAALILTGACIGLIMVELPKRPNIIWVFDLHKSVGLTVLALAIARLLWRVFDPRPREPLMPRWQLWISRLVHAVLYLLIFALPLSGWLFDSASGLRALHWFQLIEIPKLIAPAPDLRDLTRLIHQSLFWALVATLTLHVGAALKHHFIDRDNVLARMLPWRSRQLSNEP